MIDIPTILATPPVTLTPVATLPPVAVTTSVLPEPLQNLFKQLEVTGTIAQPPDGKSLVVNTQLGNLTVLLPTLVDARLEKLVQQLVTMFETQKPVTLIMQPGSPPGQASLIIPNIPLPAQTPSAPQINPAIPSLNQIQTPATATPFNTPLSAIVLPSNLSWPQSLPIRSEDPTKISYPLNSQPFSTPLQNAPAASQPASQSFLPRLLNFLTSPPTEPTNIVPWPQQSGTTRLDAAPTNNFPSFNFPQGNRVDPDATDSRLQLLTARNMPADVQSLLVPGKEIAVNILGPRSTFLPNTIPPDALLATVRGHGPNGEMIIKLDNGASLYIKNAPPLPLDTDVVVTLTTPAATTMTVLPTDQDDVALALQDLFNELSQANPGLAQQFIQNNVFQPTQPLPTALLFFMSALKQGGGAMWLGNAVTENMSRIGKAALVNQVLAELKRATTVSRDNTVGEWQTHPIPIFYNNILHTVNFHLHSNNPQDERSSSAETSARKGYLRFLIDLNMTKLGPMQIDGLVQQRKLDIMIRSEHALPLNLQNELKQSYIQSMGAIDYVGGIDFQEGRQNWLYMQQKGIKPLIT